MKWETLNFEENVPTPRRWHTITPIADTHKFLLFGGYDGDYKKLFNETHILDMNKMAWVLPKTKGDIPAPRRNHTITQISEKTLFLLGGQSENQRHCCDGYLLHLDDMSWQQVKNEGDLYCIARSSHKAVKVGEHGVIIVGGYKPKYIDPVYYLDVRMLET